MSFLHFEGKYVANFLAACASFRGRRLHLHLSCLLNSWCRGGKRNFRNELSSQGGCADCQGVISEPRTRVFFYEL